MATEVKHPTCSAVLELLQQATGLLQARLGAEHAEDHREPTSQLRALSVGYGFEALRGHSGPFSHAETRDLIHRAFVAGWLARDYQGRVNGKESQREVAAVPRPYPKKVKNPRKAVAKRGGLEQNS